MDVRGAIAVTGATTFVIGWLPAAIITHNPLAMVGTAAVGAVTSIVASHGR